MIIVMAFLDMIGVASILPFMAVLSNPDIIETNILLSNTYIFFKIFGVENKDQFVFALGLSMFFLLVLSLSFKALTSYFQMRFIKMREYSICKRLVEGYLNQPYEWFLSRNSAELGKSILSEVAQIISGGFNPLLELIAKSMVTIFIVTLLIIAEPQLVLIVVLTLGSTYGIVYLFSHRHLKKLGEERLNNNKDRFISISEAFGAAKEVKMGGLEEVYIKRFSEPAENYARNQAQASVIASLPRFFLEALGFGGILLLILYMIAKTGNVNDVLPIISLYVFAGYRLLPAIQRIYVSVTQLTYVGPSADKLYNDIKNLKEFKSIENQKIINYNKNLVLKDIFYSYPNSKNTTLDNINLTIPFNKMVGFVGTTGSGKTTTVDIILGLLQPQKGTLEIDGNIINKNNLKGWQRNIGYVPQNIYLADDTLYSNIAFGVKPNDIDKKIVEKVSQIANIHDFIIKNLPQQYETKIGERGIRLSGGQRQRIGIARALYHNPKVLVLDEATSALDNQTEKTILNEVVSFKKNFTIIMIAHRLNTLKNCDKIFILEKGKIKNEGKFEDLIKVNENFRITGNI